MAYNPDIHHRHSIRLRDFDYTTAGAYFVTMCAQNRECLFGTITDGVMVPNDAGTMLESVWAAMPENYPGVTVDAFVIMPNHIHGIIVLHVGAASRGRSFCDVGRQSDLGHPQGGAPTRENMSLPDVVHRFKSLTTARYRHGVTALSWVPFPGRLWQRNYYERIIRDDNELAAVRDYITNNPLKWADDEENPVAGQ